MLNTAALITVKNAKVAIRHSSFAGVFFFFLQTSVLCFTYVQKQICFKKIPKMLQLQTAIHHITTVSAV